MKQIVEPDADKGPAKRKRLLGRCRELGIKFPGRGQPSNDVIEVEIAKAEEAMKEEVFEELNLAEEEEIIVEAGEDLIPVEVEAELAIEPTASPGAEHPLYLLPMDIKVTVLSFDHHRAVVHAQPHNFGFWDGWTIIGAEWQRRSLLEWAMDTFGDDWREMIKAEPAGE